MQNKARPKIVFAECPSATRGAALGLLLGWLASCTLGTADPERRLWMNGRELHGSGIAREVDSCFGNLEQGRFKGTVSGLLVWELSVANPPPPGLADVKRLLPLQGAPASLEVVPDEHVVYDVSEKRYRVAVPGGSLTYTTYAAANALRLEIGGEVYGRSSIDGGCDEGIDFLNFDFVQDEKNEYLVLAVTEPLRLDGVKDSAKVAVLSPGSVLVLKFEKPAPSE